MRTNVVLDQALLKQAVELGGFKSAQEAVEAGLRFIVRLGLQKEIRKYRGKLRAQPLVRPAPRHPR